MSDNTKSLICILGGDQTHCWSQSLQIIECNIPLEISKKIFEIYNRFNDEYNNEGEYNYLGLDNLAEEVKFAREKMQKEKVKELSYNEDYEAEDFWDYIQKACKNEKERYEGVLDYIKKLDVDEENLTLTDIFMNKKLTEKNYYWLDQCRVTDDEWFDETAGGFNHWYEVMELYDADKKLPFDLNDEDIVSIFGFEKFVAFADLSYGC